MGTRSPPHTAMGSNGSAGEREDLVTALRRDVEFLATEIGPRNLYHYAALAQSADYCEHSFHGMRYTPLLQRYHARHHVFANISAEIEGSTRRDEIVVVGAHYDSHKNSPGANDNAAALELGARELGTGGGISTFAGKG